MSGLSPPASQLGPSTSGQLMASSDPATMRPSMAATRWVEVDERVDSIQTPVNANGMARTKPASAAEGNGAAVPLIS